MTETFPWPIQNAAEWLPFWKGAGFFLATFVLEDAAAIGAGLLLATGAIAWPVAFVSCWLGIWLGDTGLYALARWGGRNWFARSSLKKFSDQVAASEHWFAQRGTVILIFSRIIPGARLPTYLAAGFLRLPLPRFLLVTGAASAAWAFAVLWLAQTFGQRLASGLHAYQHGGLFLLGGAVALLIALQWFRRALRQMETRVIRARLARWRQWEFWPMWMFYPPVVAYGAWLAIRHRGLTLPTAANPGIISGGIVGESKFATLIELAATSPNETAEAILIPPGRLEERCERLNRFAPQLGLPFILKPDVGQRGVGIKLIRSRAQAEAYLRQTTASLIMQRYAPGPFEAGIFYYRWPGEKCGHIFAITEKIFPTVIGDGRSTLSDLIWSDARARCQAEIYLARLGARQNEIPSAGAVVPLVAAGNHAQGCIFRDGARWHSAELVKKIDDISQKLNGFFIGRYDLRFASEEDLRAGKNFSIIELNGAAAEATSIYDANNSVWMAYRTLFRQWALIFAIGAENRRRGAVTTPVHQLWRAWRDYAKLAATYPRAD